MTFTVALLMGTLAVLVSTDEPDLLPGDSPAAAQIYRHMAESEIQFSCAAYFLQRASYSDNDLCKPTGSFLHGLLEAKGIRPTARDVETLRVDVLAWWNNRVTYLQRP